MLTRDHLIWAVLLIYFFGFIVSFLHASMALNFVMTDTVLQTLRSVLFCGLACCS